LISMGKDDPLFRHLVAAERRVRSR
jgi:hypothetical protein